MKRHLISLLFTLLVSVPIYAQFELKAVQSSSSSSETNKLSESLAGYSLISLDTKKLKDQLR